MTEQTKYYSNYLEMVEYSQKGSQYLDIVSLICAQKESTYNYRVIIRELMDDIIPNNLQKLYEKIEFIHTEYKCDCPMDLLNWKEDILETLDMYEQFPLQLESALGEPLMLIDSVEKLYSLKIRMNKLSDEILECQPRYEGLPPSIDQKFDKDLLKNNNFLKSEFSRKTKEKENEKNKKHEDIPPAIDTYGNGEFPFKFKRYEELYVDLHKEKK